MKSEISKAITSSNNAQKRLLKELQKVTPPKTPTGAAADAVPLFTPGVLSESGDLVILMAKKQYTVEEIAILRDHLNTVFPAADYPSSHGDRCADFIERNPDHALAKELAPHATKRPAKKAAKKTVKKKA